jgi:linoleoyl-CoA desaturase
VQSRGAGGSEEAIKFGTDRAFQLELRRRVDEYFRATGRRRRDCWQMYLKTAILMASLAISYLLLVFAPQTWWQSVPLAILLGFTAAGIGFNIQHDGGHHAYSDHRWINQLMAMTLDFIGGSSYLWHWKHDVIHHTYVNVTGHDSDLNLGIFGRVTPHQRRLAFHRWQASLPLAALRLSGDQVAARRRFPKADRRPNRSPPNPPSHRGRSDCPGGR